MYLRYDLIINNWLHCGIGYAEPLRVILMAYWRYCWFSKWGRWRHPTYYLSLHRWALSIVKWLQTTKYLVGKISEFKTWQKQAKQRNLSVYLMLSENTESLNKGILSALDFSIDLNDIQPIRWISSLIPWTLLHTSYLQLIL